MKLETIAPILAGYSPITLAKMERVRLMNRVDTKFITSTSKLPELLNCLQAGYLMQEINGSRLNAYHTLYLDTVDRAMYLTHHNGRRTREKIRVRSYFDSQSVFLEVKNKNNKGRTKKKRFELPEMTAYKQQNAVAFLETYAKYPPEELHPQLEIEFHRITLVNSKKTERLTIDMNLAFRNPAADGAKKQLDELVIIELKQQGQMASHAKSLLSELHIRPVSVSKYCLGTMLTVPDIKNNLFKEKMIQINKIREKQYGFV